jgi:hypothetical protein
MVTRGCVPGRVGEVKTEYPHRPLPLDADLAAERAKLNSIGRHTFRHSYQAWLKRVGASLEIQQELI